MAATDTLESLKAEMARLGWTDLTVETFPEHGVTKAYAISPDGKWSMGGVYTASGVLLLLDQTKTTEEILSLAALYF